MALMVADAVLDPADVPEADNEATTLPDTVDVPAAVPDMETTSCIVADAVLVPADVPAIFLPETNVNVAVLVPLASLWLAREPAFIGIRHATGCLAPDGRDALLVTPDTVWSPELKALFVPLRSNALPRPYAPTAPNIRFSPVI